jgi:hypothetical protein
MENHPIPQDITGFQFKLIGNMTVKQFAYLAAGAAFAYVCYILPINAFLRFPFVFLFALIGAAFAFLPIEGRPLDTMLGYFFKATFGSTQFIYDRSGRPLFIQGLPITQSSMPKDSKSEDKLKNFLDSLPKQQRDKLDEKEMVFFQSLGSLSAPAASAQTQPTYVTPHVMDYATVNQAQPTPEQKTDENPQNEEVQLEKETQTLQAQLIQAKQEERVQQGTAAQEQAHQKALELEKLLNDTVAQKQELEKQLLTLKKTLESQQKQVFTPTIATAPMTATKNVRVVPKNMGKSIGVPNAPEFPNIVSGIVKDPRGNPLSNVLVEIKDSENNPVRAFKTNALGQFASATPLTNGTYTIEFDDPKSENKFDTIQFSASGEIILPVEVISVDKREELRRSLFN